LVNILNVEKERERERERERDKILSRINVLVIKLELLPMLAWHHHK